MPCDEDAQRGLLRELELAVDWQSALSVGDEVRFCGEIVSGTFTGMVRPKLWELGEDGGIVAGPGASPIGAYPLGCVR